MIILLLGLGKREVQHFALRTKFYSIHKIK